MLSEPAALILAQSFAELLGKPEPGNMAFIRCLPSEVSIALAAHARFTVRGWRVAVVVDNPDPQTRRIAADQAVEWREGKGQATLLLVDPTQAGAGMDGDAVKLIARRVLLPGSRRLHRRWFSA